MKSPALPLSGCFRLPQRATLVFSGPDAKRYLNGQVSIDATRLQPLIARPACLLTAKGKLCARIFIWKDNENFIVETEPELAEAVQMRLERYIIADDVRVTLQENMPASYHVFGIENNDGRVAINRIGIPGFDTPEKPNGFTELPLEAVEFLRINHGVPAWGHELNEDTLPQEARLENTAVDFDKGCYVGQEVVSRLKSVGRVNKRLHGFLGSFDHPLPAGAKLHPLGQPEIIAGHLNSTSEHFGIAQTIALGYLQRQFEDLPRLAVCSENGHLLGEVERREFPIL
jgi:folate-binding protein YgfZ